MTKPPRRPTAFRIDELTKLDPAYEPGIGAPPALSSEPDELAESEADGADAQATPPRQSRRWSQLLAAAVSGLIVLAVGLAVDNLIEGLFSRSSILGWLGIVLAGLAGVALLALAIREIVGLLRIRRIADIHQRAAAAAL